MYFVYELQDPRNGQTFYVGKGKDNRPAQHTKEALSGKRTAKCARIREIIDAGLAVRVIYVREFTTEKTAYAFEKRHIKAIGLDKLTNMQPGGPATWATKADPDTSMLEVIALVMRKTRGFKDGAYRWYYCGEWHPLPDTLIPSIRKRFFDILANRGFDWTAKVLAKHKVVLRPAEVLRTGC